MENNITKCWFCKSEMMWNCDYDFKDYGIDGKGVVVSLSCPNCGATADFYSKENES